MAHLSKWLLSLAALTALSLPAAAHDWYPYSCCGGKDCHPLIEEKGETVTEEAEGWKLWDGRVVARGIAQPSPDGRFHLCETPAKTILCFFAPPGAS